MKDGGTVPVRRILSLSSPFILVFIVLLTASLRLSPLFVLTRTFACSSLSPYITSHVGLDHLQSLSRDPPLAAHRIPSFRAISQHPFSLPTSSSLPPSQHTHPPPPTTHMQPPLHLPALDTHMILTAEERLEGTSSSEGPQQLHSTSRSLESVSQHPQPDSLRGRKRPASGIFSTDQRNIWVW